MNVVAFKKFYRIVIKKIEVIFKPNKPHKSSLKIKKK